MQCPQAGVESGPLDLGMRALAMRPHLREIGATFLSERNKVFSRTVTINYHKC